MRQNKFWDKDFLSTVTRTKYFLSKLSIKVRTDQYRYLRQKIKLTSKSKVLDVGVTSDELLPDSNMFEKLYPWQNKLTLATIENSKMLEKLYPRARVVKIKPHQRLPFKDKQFDLVTSWATLEHVGNYNDQENFINELNRIAKKVFITTPYRGCPYEPHTGYFFLHWLPLSLYRAILKRTKNKIWADEKNLNPLFVRDVKNMKLTRKLQTIIYNMFGFLPSHLLIHS